MNLSPVHLHLLLNHLPIVGLAMAVLALFLSIVTRNRGAQIISLILILLTSSAAWPVYATGEKAYKSVRSVVDDDGSDWLDTHWDRADKVIWYFAIPASLSLMGIFLPRRFSEVHTAALWGTFLSATVCLGLSAWVADAGGKISHPEIRQATTPTP